MIWLSSSRNVYDYTLGSGTQLDNFPQVEEEIEEEVIFSSTDIEHRNITAK